MTTLSHHADRRDADHANRIIADLNSGAEMLLTSEEVDHLLAAKTPMAFWRRHRGLTQEALSKTTGLAQNFLSEIENGSKTGDVQTVAQIARALSVAMDDLVIEPAPVKSRGKRSRRR